MIYILMYKTFESGNNIIRGNLLRGGINNKGVLRKMKFDVKNSKLVYEVRDLGHDNDKERWMHEQLYRRKSGTYFLHFEGGPKSRYGIRVGFYKDIGRSGNYKMEEEDIEIWKRVSDLYKQDYPESYIIIDWEKEEDESVMKEESQLSDDDLIPMGEISEDELPF